MMSPSEPNAQCTRIICVSSSTLYTETRSSATAERPARRSASVEMLAYCCTNNANRSLLSLKSTFSNCHVLFGYLHGFVHASLQYRLIEHAMPWVLSTDFHTTNLVDVNWTVTAINIFRLTPKLLMTPRIPPLAHRRGRRLL